jgi:hypothetical protein
MADSTSHVPQVTNSQSSKEVTVNIVNDANSPAGLFGRNGVTTTGLTWGYLGGKYRKADGTILTVANATLALTAAATNYILETDGVVSKVTAAPSGWPGPLAAGATALYAVIAGATAVTSYTDYRAAPNPQSTSPAETVTTIGALINGATSKTTPVDADMLGLMDSAASNVLKKLSWANVKATLKTYFDTLYAPLTQPIVAAIFYPGAPGASALMGVFAAPAGITTLTFAAAISGSAGKALTAATAQTDIDVRKNATTVAGGSSVGTIRFAAAGTVPTFIAASGFTLTGGTDYLSFWAPATPDATLANIGVSLYGTR